MQNEEARVRLTQALTARLRSAFPELTLALDEPESGEDGWRQSISLRQGSWAGVDVEIHEKSGEISVEISEGSRGGTALVLGGALAAVALSLASGDWILRAVGLKGVATALTVALGTIPFLLVTLPAAAAARWALSRGGAEKNRLLLGQVREMLRWETQQATQDGVRARLICEE